MTGGRLDVEELFDREEIRDALARYSRGIDRHDTEIAVSAFHPDAVDDHRGVDRSPADLAEWGNTEHARRWLAHTHFLGHTTFDFDGDTCHTETYVMAIQRRNDGDGNDALGGRYLDRFEKRDGAWRIARRVLVLDWTGALPAGDERSQGLLDVYETGRWDRSDLSYARPLP